MVDLLVVASLKINFLELKTSENYANSAPTVTLLRTSEIDANN